MRRLKPWLAALIMLTPSVAVLSAPAQAAPGDGLLISNGSVRLSSLVTTTGKDGVTNPEFPVAEEGDDGEGGEPENPGAGPRVPSAEVRAAGAGVGLTFAGLNHR